MSAALVISLIIFLAILFSGYLNGLFGSVATLLMLTISFAFSMSYYGPLASMGLCRPMGDYAEPICLIGLFVVVYFVLQVLSNVLALSIIRLKPLVDKLGGLAVGLANALLVTGFLGIVFYMMPWTGVHKGYHSFIGTNIALPAIERLTGLASFWGGTALDADGLFKRLKRAESDRRCYRNMMNILDRLTDIYSDWDLFGPLTEAKLNNALVNGTNLRPAGASRGKGVGADGILCPHSNRPYVIRVLQRRDILFVKKGKVVHVYDSMSLHDLDGKPARMVLRTYLERGGKVKGDVELMSEEEFKQALKVAK